MEGFPSGERDNQYCSHLHHSEHRTVKEMEEEEEEELDICRRENRRVSF